VRPAVQDAGQDGRGHDHDEKTAAKEKISHLKRSIPFRCGGASRQATDRNDSVKSLVGQNRKAE
jgi:hypothetical protein